MLPLTRCEIEQAVSAYERDYSEWYGDLFSVDQLTNLKRAAVMIPIFEHENEWHILLTQRSDTLEEHRGQVAFPGGAREQQDVDLSETALREMKEEIGVDPQDVVVFGHLGDMPVVTGYMVRPYVGHIPWPYTFVISRDEVQSIFTIPLYWLADRNNRKVQLRHYAGSEFTVTFFNPYDGYQLWGASAEMALAFLSALNLLD